MRTNPVAGDLLHHDCGMHRGSAPTADGALVAKFERDYLAHKAAGQCAVHARATAIPSHPGDDSCSACGQASVYHGAS